MPIETIQGVVLCLMLGGCSVFDIKQKQIPVSIIVMGGIAAVICSCMNGGYTPFDTLLGIGLGLLLYGISKMTRESIGMGDVLIFFVLGAALGGMQALFVLFYSVFFAAIYSLGLVVLRRVSKKQTIPFLPFIFMAYLGVWML